MSNLALWDRVSKTDPNAVKPITGKQYQGNSPKPYYIVERLTQEFGPCGIGWGMNVINERFERFSDTDTLHVALVELWYILGEKRGSLCQMGQTKASYMSSKGAFILDEDAPKKSVTDALVKCASYLGFAGDIFSGRWDDSKYVAQLRKEFGEPGEGIKKEVKGVMGAVLDNTPALPEDEQQYIYELSVELTELFNVKGAKTAYDRVQIEGLAADQSMYLWAQLPSNVRSGLKAEKAKRANMAAA